MKGGCGSFRSWVVGCDEVAREWRQQGGGGSAGACRAIWNAGSAGTLDFGWNERWLEPKAADRRTETEGMCVR